MKKESITLRIILISAIIFVLLIPLFMIESLITERQSYRNDAIKEVSKSWAGSQVVGGPVLTLHSTIENVDQKGNSFFINKNYHYLPDTLEYLVEVTPEKRHRGIYEIMLYSAKINIRGSINLEKIKERFQNQKYDESYLSINISDLRGIQNDPQLKINQSVYSLLPGLKSKEVYSSGLFSDVNINEQTNKLDFSLDIQLNGLDNLSFLPVGKSTALNVKSSWNNPSFSGAYLPSVREINQNGFSANWRVNYFNRSFPQNWEDDKENISPSAFGVKFLLPVDEYQKTMRISKYGLMIIVLTFLSFFMIELFSKRVIHPIQYLLVGLALVIFYSLLLSISEYVTFAYSYLFSALLVISLVGFYVKSIYKSLKIGSIMFGILIGVYGLMYVILQIQDYSLLVGNIVLFLVLALIMFLTRKLNWYDVLSSKSNL